MNVRSTFFSLFLASFMCAANAAHALPCEEKNGVVDFNCDGRVGIAVFGDSIAYGRGDTANGNKGGYVLRAARRLPDTTVYNLGKNGMFAEELGSTVTNVFIKGKRPDVKEKFLKSDIIIIDLGRNNRWAKKAPSLTQQVLKRGATRLREAVLKEKGVAPMVVIASMILPNRGSQGGWVAELNALIRKGGTSTIPGDLRFDQVSKRLLSDDRLHPTPKGYDAMASKLVSYLRGKLAARMNSQRPDLDSNGVPDMFE